MSEIVSPRHILLKKRQKTVNDYSKKSIDNFKLVVDNTSLEIIDQEKQIIETYFGCLSQYQGIKNNSKKNLNCLLKYHNENFSLYPSKNILTPAEHVPLKILYIEIKLLFHLSCYIQN